MISGKLEAKRRILMCQQCGAPMEIGLKGGFFTCEFCTTTTQFVARQQHKLRFPDPTVDPSLDDAVREAARLELLKAQAEHYNSKTNPYAYIDAPLGMEWLWDLDIHAPSTLKTFLNVFKQTCSEYDPSKALMSEERKLVWLVRKLNTIYGQRNEKLQARALLETTLELVSDLGFQQILLCSLSDMARRSNDLESAEAWLSQCDPRPAILDLDGEYRFSYAALLLAKGRHKEVLAVVGKTRGQIPYEESNVAVDIALRVAAYERLGIHQRAEQELSYLVDTIDNIDWVYRFFNNNPAWAPCLGVLQRLNSSTNKNPAISIGAS